MDIIAYILAKKFVKKSLAGLGALRGSPCKVKSIEPVYSTEDPDVVIKNIVTLQWDSNEDRDPSAQPIWHEEKVNVLDNGRGIHDIEFVPEISTAEKNFYKVTFYDGTTDQFYIPTSSGSLKKKVVATLPTASSADKNTIYLVPVPGKVGSYQQWLAVENDSTHSWEWLSLGTTDVDLSAYQPKIDPNINKVYPNYDPATKTETPTARNVVGALNEFNNVLGATYNYTKNEISNLTTHDKKNIVSVLNELGDITTAEMYDATNRNTYVKLINAANSEFSIDQGTVDRTKYIDVLDPKRDAKDGSAKTDAGLDIKIPRVDIVKRATAATEDFRTYDLKVGDALSDPKDPDSKVFGQVHIPKIKIKKIAPPAVSTTDTTEVATWTTSGSDFTSNITLTHIPMKTETISAIMTPGKGSATAKIALTQGSVSAKATVSGAGTSPGLQTLKYTFMAENPMLAAEYYLEIEGKDYSFPVSGDKIEIAKGLVLKSASVKKCEQDGVPLANLHKDELYLDLEFETGNIPTHAYIRVLDMVKPYEGLEAVKVEYNATKEVNQISLKINDPDDHKGLVQTTNGLQVMLATEEQKGLVERATQAEERAATDSVRYVTPLQLHDFVVNSESVKGDLGDLYKDADGKIVNDTVISAINETASVKVKALDTPEDGDINTYIAQTHPDENTWRTLGDKIHDKKVIYQVEKLSTVSSPKDYELYYLTTLETKDNVDYEPGLYMYDKTNLKWVAVTSDGGIIYVDELPTEHIKEKCFYLVPDDRIIEGRYTLSEEAIEAGYTADENGIDLASPAQHWTWAQITADWANWVDDELVESTTGKVCHLSDNTITWDYLEENNHLYYHYKTQWIEAPVIKPITNEYIDSLEMWN